MIDTLCDRIDENSIAVASIYCDFLGSKEQTTGNMIGALVNQLVRVLGMVPPEIDGAFKKAKRNGRGLRVPDVIKLLEAALARLDRTFICIDGLDECPDKILPELLRSLHAISQGSPSVRLFITGRPHVQSVLERYFPNSVQVIPISPNSGDIRGYIEKALLEDLSPKAMDCTLEAEIMERIQEQISGVYVIVISKSKDQNNH